MQACHPERSEGSLAGQRSFAALRMTSEMVSYLKCIGACPRPGVVVLAGVVLWRGEATVIRRLHRPEYK